MEHKIKVKCMQCGKDDVIVLLQEANGILERTNDPEFISVVKELEKDHKCIKCELEAEMFARI